MESNQQKNKIQATGRRERKAMLEGRAPAKRNITMPADGQRAVPRPPKEAPQPAIIPTARPTRTPVQEEEIDLVAALQAESLFDTPEEPVAEPEKPAAPTLPEEKESEGDALRQRLMQTPRSTEYTTTQLPIPMVLRQLNTTTFQLPKEEVQRRLQQREEQKTEQPVERPTAPQPVGQPQPVPKAEAKPERDPLFDTIARTLEREKIADAVTKKVEQAAQEESSLPAPSMSAEEIQSIQRRVEEQEWAKQPAKKVAPSAERRQKPEEWKKRKPEKAKAPKPEKPKAPKRERPKGAERSRKKANIVVVVVAAILALVLAAGGWLWLKDKEAKTMPLPEIAMEFNGQSVSPNAYDWYVSVLGESWKERRFGTLRSEANVLNEPITTLTPTVTVDGNYPVTVTVWDENGNTIFYNTARVFSEYQLPGNGNYQVMLMVSKTEGRITGSQTYFVSFKVNVS